MSKRGKKSTVETLQLVERPFADDQRVLEAAELSDRWASRVHNSTDALHDVQQSLQQLAGALQAFERERLSAEVQAVYLAALNVQGLLEYRLNRGNGADGLTGARGRERGASTANRKASSRPSSNSARRPASGSKATAAKGTADDVVASLVSAASAVTSDPKRRQRCMSALQQYFKTPCAAAGAADDGDVPAADSTAGEATAEGTAADSDTPSPHSTHGGGSPVRGPRSSGATRPISASMGSSQALAIAGVDGASANGSSGAGQPRRPREVPSALWDEMTQLRRLYYSANDKVTALARAITEQLQRFTIVRDNNEVACYAMEAVQVGLKHAVADAAAAAVARQQAEAAAASEAKTRGASASSGKGKKG